MKNDFADRIRATLKMRKLSGEELAAKIGSHPVTISKLLTGKMKMTEAWMMKLAEGLDMTVEDILATGAARETAAPAQHLMPVFGLAAASVRGNFTMSNDPIEWVPRPRALAHVRDAYALTVTGSSMEPRYFPGDVVFIHPGREPNAGDHVVIQESIDGGTMVSIKRFDRKTPEYIFATQYNPLSELRFLREKVKYIHRVLTPNEVAGV